MNTKLSDLVKKDEDVREELLAGALFPFMEFTESGELLPTPAYKRLDTKKKVVVILLCGLALSQLGKRKNYKLTPKEITTASGIPAGSVRPALKGLLKDRIVAMENGEYWIPTHNFAEVQNMLKGEQL